MTSRSSIKLLGVVASLLLFITANTSLAAEKPTYGVDEASGLIMAPGWETVKTNCTVCHSARFITLQRGDRDSWESIIRWMQKTQGLWQFPGDMEMTILDYLSTNYPPGKPSRRANLPPRLMPGNS